MGVRVLNIEFHQCVCVCVCEGGGGVGVRALHRCLPLYIHIIPD